MAEEQDAMVAEPIGTRLRAAREAQGMSLDDVAAKTRVPIRHLQHMEQEEWDELPAATYSVGFARAYANAVGLNGSEIGSELRAQLGATPMVPVQAHYEPADPARVPPRAVAIIAAIVAVVLAIGYLVWRSGAVDDTAMEQAEIASVENLAEASAPPAAPLATAADAPVTGPVVLTATGEVWLRVYEAGGARLYENILQPGQSYTVPATAARPQILTGRPQLLRVTVGTRQLPPLEPVERTIADVSLLPADLVARANRPQAAVPSTSRPAAASQSGTIQPSQPQAPSAGSPAASDPAPQPPPEP